MNKLSKWLHRRLRFSDKSQSNKKKSSATVIVLMTGDEKEVILSRIKGTSVDQVLFKPFTLAKMAETVQGLLHS
jgi:hypothetical protein